MATYPTDATVDISSYNAVSSVSYNNTASNTEFNINTTVTYLGEVLATIDGSLIDPETYYLSNNNYTVNFYGAPNASNLTLRVIEFPSQIRVNKTFPRVDSVTYSNTESKVINSNSYLLNGIATSFAIPESVQGATIDSNSIFVVLSGNFQNPNQFTYPSATLGFNGVDLPVAPALPADDFANANLVIRTLYANTTVETVFTNMGDRKPDRGYGTSKEFSYDSFASQAGYETRRLLTRRSKSTYSLSYTNVTGYEKEAIETFYNNRYGGFEAFTLDLTHLNSTGTKRVKFDGDLNINHMLSRGSALIDNFYTISFTLKEDYN